MSFSYNKSKPVAGPNSPPISADMRNNFGGLQEALGAVNLLRDHTFLCWPTSDIVAPAHWSVSGTGVAIARAGTGLGDTRRKLDAFTAKVTAGGAATGFLDQDILTTTSYDDGFDGFSFAFGCWIYTASASSVKVGIWDGVGTTWSTDDDGNPTFGVANTWTWLTGVRTIDNAATRITFRVSHAAAVVGYASGPTVLLGSAPPLYPHPGRVARVYPGLTDTGAITASRTYLSGIRWPAPMPGVARITNLVAGTGPTGQAAIYDVNKNGTSMYSTRPQIAAGATTGNAAPDSGTYSTRCFTRGDVLSFDCDQVGSGVAGADVTIQAELLMFPGVLDQYLLPTEIN